MGRRTMVESFEIRFQIFFVSRQGRSGSSRTGSPTETTIADKRVKLGMVF